LAVEPISDPSKLKAEATYNAAADHFDDGPLAFWDRYGRRTVDRLCLAPGSSLLDVGCGSGASAIPAAINVGPEGRVIGIDLAERLLAITRLKRTMSASVREELRLRLRDHLPISSNGGITIDAFANSIKGRVPE
jgi:ubiquinone/menaquinone biosynthesis C-methylase UbiE